MVADSHLALPIDRRDFSDLDDDLTPYRRLIDNNLPAVMDGDVQDVVDACRTWFQAEALRQQQAQA